MLPAPRSGSLPPEYTMLVLSRQRDESIIIGDNIVMTVVDVRGDKVRLGIDAPREVSVHRREIYEAIQRENKQAAQIRLDEARQIGKSPAGSAVEPIAYTSAHSLRLSDAGIRGFRAQASPILIPAA